MSRRSEATTVFIQTLLSCKRWICCLSETKPTFVCYQEYISFFLNLTSLHEDS